MDEFGGLFLDGGNNGRVAMTERVNSNAGGEVEGFAPVGVSDFASMPFGNGDARGVGVHELFAESGCDGLGLFIHRL